MAVASLVSRFPPLDVARLVADQVPPPQFAHARFANYRPDISQPSQSAALRRMRALAHSLQRKESRLSAIFRKRPHAAGVYLDGGYGVGKTHLLAALAHEIGPGGATYGTFVEYTHLVGALGYAAAFEQLRGRILVCIDEFELDDPGDTLIMSRLIRDLSSSGVCVVATSNTQPGALGQGRFAAEDFKREIQSLASRFEIARIDGPDYRARTLDLDVPAPSPEAIRKEVATVPGASLDDFTALIEHLGQVHPSRYGQLLDEVSLVGLTGSVQLDDEAAGLRLVVLIDRLYDRSLPVRLDLTVGELFSSRMRAGGYKKKYLRAMSRLAALTQLPGQPAEPGAPGHRDVIEAGTNSP